MGKLARIVLGAVIIGTLLGVVFFELTRIGITGGLVSLFALIGLIGSWLAVSAVDMILTRGGRTRHATPSAKTPAENTPTRR